MSLSLSGDGTVTGVTAIGDVSSTELGYLDGVTSALQTQINTKADASTQGLVLIDEESFSAVSSVSLNNVFSATYANYLILTQFTTTASAQINIRLRSSGTDDSSTNYRRGLHRLTESVSQYDVGSAASTVGILNNNTASERAIIKIECFGPYLSQTTQLIHNSQGETRNYFGFTRNVSSTQFDGFTIYPESGGGTITGNIRVYGYKGA